MPAPAATPPTLAMVGLGNRCSRRATSPSARIRTQVRVTGPAGGVRRGPRGPRPSRRRRRPRSAPAPGPPGRPPPRRRSASSSRSIVPLAAFLRSGRFMVTVTTPSSRSTIRVSMGSAMAAEPTEIAPPGQNASSSTSTSPAVMDDHVEAQIRPGPVPTPGSARPASGRPGAGSGAAWPAATASAPVPKASDVRVFTSQKTTVRPRADDEVHLALAAPPVALEDLVAVRPRTRRRPRPRRARPRRPGGRPAADARPRARRRTRRLTAPCRAAARC